MANINPCVKDCPRRKLGCRTDCPDWAAAQAEREKIRKARDRDLLVGDYFKDRALRSRRRSRDR